MKPETGTVTHIHVTSFWVFSIVYVSENMLFFFHAMAKGKKTDVTIELRLKPINLHYVTQIFCTFLSLGINPPYIFTFFRRKKIKLYIKEMNPKDTSFIPI